MQNSHAVDLYEKNKKQLAETASKQYVEYYLALIKWNNQNRITCIKLYSLRNNWKNAGCYWVVFLAFTCACEMLIFGHFLYPVIHNMWKSVGKENFINTFDAELFARCPLFVSFCSLLVTFCTTRNSERFFWVKKKRFLLAIARLLVTHVPYIYLVDWVYLRPWCYSRKWERGMGPRFHLVDFVFHINQNN